MGLGVFARRRDERRAELGARVAFGYAGLLVVFVAYAWWTGRAPPGWAVGGLVFAGAVAGLAARARDGALESGALAVLVLISAVAATLHRPLAFDLLAWAALFFVLRGHLAVRRLDAADAAKER